MNASELIMQALPRQLLWIEAALNHTANLGPLLGQQQTSNAGKQTSRIESPFLSAKRSCRAMCSNDCLSQEATFRCPLSNMDSRLHVR
jgi:hypothetical protein